MRGLTIVRDAGCAPVAWLVGTRPVPCGAGWTAVCVARVAEAASRATPGDAILVAGDAPACGSGLAELRHASLSCPLTSFVVHAPSHESCVPSPALRRAAGPGWVTWVASDQVAGWMDRVCRSTADAVGIGAHHLGITLSVRSCLADDAVTELLAASGAGPSLTEAAELLLCSPSSLAHALERQLGQGWSCIRERRIVGLAVGALLAGDGVTQVADRLRLSNRQVLRLLGARLPEWRALLQGDSLALKQALRLALRGLRDGPSR
jgi:hypothetical protein